MLCAICHKIYSENAEESIINDSLTNVIVYDNIVLRSDFIIKEEKKWEWKVEFYQKINGGTPVRNFLLTLSPKMRAKAYSEIELLKEHGFYLREPYVKPIVGEQYKGIYELRIKLGSDASRIFYFTYSSNTFVLLNGFLKKTNKTPKAELEKAKKYRKDFEKRCKDE
jgi:phage-related protein